MEPGSEEEINRNVNQGPPDASKRPKRQMKTPFQLEVLEKTYAVEMYPSEATREELSEKLGLTDRQLQMWFCHRRLKDKKEAAGMAATNPRTTASVGKKVSIESPGNGTMVAESSSGHESGSRSGSDSGSRSGQSGDGDRMPTVPARYYDSPRSIMEQRVIACVEAQLGEPLREDGPILGMEFDELPPGAFGAPIALSAEQRDRYKQSYGSKSYRQCDTKQIKAASSGLHEITEPKMRPDMYGHGAVSYPYESTIDGHAAKSLPLTHGNKHLPEEYILEGQVPSVDRWGQFSSSPKTNACLPHSEDNSHTERKRKSDEAKSGREVQANEKKTRKEIEKQEILRRKREEQMRKEMERLEREKRKEEQRMMREQQKQEEKFQREERREMERREKFMQKELLREERRKQKEERRQEKESARQKAAAERATARKIAKESMELIEDERLELMELAASRKGLPSIVTLDYDTMQNLESFRDDLCQFPPKTVQLKKPFDIQPWIGSEENVGNLFMVWRFCITFADVLGLWPFTLDEFVQSFHDYDSRLLGEIHIALLKLIIKDIEDVARTPSGGPGTNQYSAVNPEGGHPHIVEGAYLWGFDIRNWLKHLNPLTWPEILRQFALSAGFGPQLKKKNLERGSRNDNDEIKGCEDIVSTLRNGSAAENAVAIMQEKGLGLQRKSRHRLTPGTVKFAAYHVLALEGSKGLNVIEIADKIQKSGLRDLSTSRTPEASISVALSRDPILFERVAPSTYCVRPAFRKDPADAESILAAAREKIQRYANGFLAGQNAEDLERDDDSDSDAAEGTEGDVLATPSDTNMNNECNEVVSCSGSGKDNHRDADAQQNEICIGTCDTDQIDTEIDESRSGQPWVQGLTEGEFSNLSVEERLNALVSLIGIANEGNSIRVILEDRMDAANALKKQMWAEAQLDKRRMREEIVKFHDYSFTPAADGGQSPLAAAQNNIYDPSLTTSTRYDHSCTADDIRNSNDNPAQDTSMGQFGFPIQQNGYTTERSRLQLKSYIGHRAEEMYVYRSLPLGQDRRRNRYWQFVASPSSQDPGSGRIFVESPDGYWRLIDTKEAFDALMMSLDTRGTRESHLHIMLQKIEVSFKECIQRNNQLSVMLGQGGKEAIEVNSTISFTDGAESPSSVVCSANADKLEPSHSFKIDLGRNETEKKNSLNRYNDLQVWMWKECFSSSILRAMAHGKKRCSTLLGICDVCFSFYNSKEDLCPSCCRTFDEVGGSGNLLEKISCVEKLKSETNTVVSNSSPSLRIRLIKTLLTFLEVSVPSEALKSSWTEDYRDSWGLKLQNSSSTEDLLQVNTMRTRGVADEHVKLLQILTQFEDAVKCDYLSTDFETTAELLSYCAAMKNAATESAYSGCVTSLPWIPRTTAAVALRLFELDASIFYVPQQKAEVHDEKPGEALPKFTFKYSYAQYIPKTENTEMDQHGPVKERNWGNPRDIPGSLGSRQVARKRGSGRPRGKSRKRALGSIQQSNKKGIKQGEMLTQVLMQQHGERTGGQSHARGRRTLRKRRTDKKVALQMLPDHEGPPEDVLEEPINSVHEDLLNFDTRNIENENDDSSNSMEVGDFDDNAQLNTYEYGQWGSGYDYVSSRSKEMEEMSDGDVNGMEDDNGRGYGYEDEEDGENMEMNDNSDGDGEGDENKEDEGSDSMVSGDYSSD